MEEKNIKTARTKKPKSAEDMLNKSIRELVQNNDILLLAYILKTTTNEEKAMSISEVSEQLNCLVPPIGDNECFSDRTLRRRFEVFANLESSKIEILAKINKLLPFVLGGQISSRATNGIMNGTNTRSSGKQKRFYFEPVLSSGDMDLVWGSIRSSRFLSEAEKDYLLKRLHILMPEYNFTDDHIDDNSYRHIFEIENLPEKPKPAKNAALPMDSSKLLSNIQIIHEAIENELQLEVTYGTYDIMPGSPKIDFHPRNPEKPYILNPYAMMWNDGEYYLIATHYNYTNPAHFRLDRIMSVKIHTKKNKNGELEEVKRNKLPDTLKPFFVKPKGEKPIFDNIKYANTYPGMKIFNTDNKIDVTFECTPRSLQILIDNFGPDIRLSDSPVKHSKSELINNGTEQKFLAAKIKNIQYENAYEFAISHSEYLTLIGPDNLAKEVSEKLQEVANRYKKYLK